MEKKVSIITPLSRGLPKTGQVTSYRAGDDGTTEEGWWFNRLNANNRVRFVEKEIVSGEPVILDLATGLMWVKDGGSRGCYNGNQSDWPTMIDYGLFLDYGGFDDWRMPNAMELFSIVNLSLENPAIWAIFTNTQTDDNYSYWTSNTLTGSSDNKFIIMFSNAIVYFKDDGGLAYLRPVRRFAK